MNKFTAATIPIGRQVSPITRSCLCRSARTGVTLLLLVLGLAVGAIGGSWWARNQAAVDVGAPSDSASAGNEQKMYSCGMHPQVLQRGPGLCPICHMKLTPLDGNSSGPAHEVRIDPRTVQNMGVRTVVVSRGLLAKAIRTIGRVDYDEQRVSNVQTKFEGWIEELYVNETGQSVQTGQPLFDVYSPQLYAAQEELLAAAESLSRLQNRALSGTRGDTERLVEAARRKLENLDVSGEQIDALLESGRARKALTIHSPSSGIVTEKTAFGGLYVTPGMRLYTIADLSHVWVYVDIYEHQLPWVGVGQAATMTLPYAPGRSFEGKVVYIYPYVDKQSRVVRVRLEFENPSLELKPDMFATVNLTAELTRDALVIPRDAFMDTGIRRVAFVSLGEGRFEPRELRVGVEGEGGVVEVLSGLEEGESIVVSGQFLLDAESKLQDAMARMSASAAEVEAAPPEALAIPAGARFSCTMQECRQFSAEPADCSVCGMKMVPLGDLEWARAARESADSGRAIRYVCPMHSQEFSGAAGRCRVCGMQLVVEQSGRMPLDAPQAVAAQMDFITEHYLELGRLLASDRTTEVALHAGGLAGAADELLRHLGETQAGDANAVRTAAEKLRAAAIRTTGTRLDADRAAFAEISAAMSILVDDLRPSREHWPLLYLFHCAVSKADWIQDSQDKRNPYYGFKMLKCGEPRGTR